jgi:hypothetical protein
MSVARLRRKYNRARAHHTPRADRILSLLDLHMHAYISHAAVRGVCDEQKQLEAKSVFMQNCYRALLDKSQILATYFTHTNIGI